MRLKQELDSLRDILKNELSHTRINPNRISSGENADHLRALLEEEKLRNDSLSARVDDLKAEIYDAGEFIDSLKNELKRESDEVIQLQNKLSESNQEYVCSILEKVFSID
jgi:chromosome segregation ATPase